MEGPDSAVKKLNNSMDGPLYFRIASFFMYNCVAIPVTGLMLFLLFGGQVKGRKNLKGHRRGLIAANHCQYLEPAFSGVSIWPRKLLFSAEENNATRKDVGWLTRLLRTFGIPDENPMSIAGFIKKALERNWFVHFYPEGTISWRCQEPGPFLEGVFFFAFLNNVPVFPIAEVLRERPLRRLVPGWPPRTTFVIGPPLYPDDFRMPGLSRRDQVHGMSKAVHDFITLTIAEEGGCTALPERRPAVLKKPIHSENI
jgi:1-acyl-sn-glycerol-3-phosphate acyltransferase